MNQRIVILCVGVRIDFVGCIENPKFCNNSVALSMFKILKSWKRRAKKTILRKLSQHIIQISTDNQN